MSESRPSAAMYPVFLDLAGRRVLVVGAGNVAERRVRALLDSDAVVTVVAPEAAESIERAACDGDLTLLRRAFDPADVGGHVLVLSATGVADVDAEVSAAAREAGVFVNAADEIGLSDFHLPAVLRRDSVQVAVSTGGAAPGLASVLRDRIASVVGDEWGRLAGLLGRVRRLARARIEDPVERMALMRRLASDAELLLEIERGVIPEPESVLDRVSDVDFVAEVEARSAGTEGPTRALVSIVGAGPGDAGLITVAGAERLKQADVVVFDDLVDPRLLAYAPAHAELIRGGVRGWSNRSERPGPQLLVAKAIEGRGRRVVRLKGGDPSVFGRLAEELDALERSAVPFEVIPGVTAALAAAAGAGVSLTKRGCASSVTLVTAVGDGSSGCEVDSVASLIQSGGTVAVYMGLRRLSDLTAGLLRFGVEAGLPVKVVASASTAHQRVVDATLSSVADEVLAADLVSPVMVLMGRALR